MRNKRIHMGVVRVVANICTQVGHRSIGRYFGQRHVMAHDPHIYVPNCNILSHPIGIVWRRRQEQLEQKSGSEQDQGI